MKKNRIWSWVFALVATLSYQMAFSQCQGPTNNGDPIVLATPGTSVTINLGGGFDVEITRIGNEVFAIPGMGVKIHSDGMDNAISVMMGDNITALPMTSFSPNAQFMFDMNTSFGPFGGGFGGYLALMTDDGKFGFVEIGDCGVLTCSLDEYTLRVSEAGLGITTGIPVLAGDCNALSIPTLSQWALFILALLFMNIALVTIQLKNRDASLA